MKQASLASSLFVIVVRDDVILYVQFLIKNAISHITNSNGDCVSGPNEIANELNNFFSSIGANLATNILSHNSNCIYNTIKPPLTYFLPTEYFH